MMTKKNFVAIAKGVKAQVDQIDNYALYTTQEHKFAKAVVRRVVGELCAAFAADNPNFNRARFIEACGFEE